MTAKKAAAPVKKAAPRPAPVVKSREPDLEAALDWAVARSFPESLKHATTVIGRAALPDDVKDLLLESAIRSLMR